MPAALHPLGTEGVPFTIANQNSPTTRKELTGSVDQEPGRRGGAYGASPPPPCTEGTPCTNQNFPTTAKEREKKKDVEDKSKGIEKVVKKKPEIIERHHDDCGESLKGLCEGFHLSHM